MRISRETLTGGLGAILSMVLAACGHPPAPQTLTGQTMGTSYNLRLGEIPSGLDLADLQAVVSAELDAVNAAMSNWDPESELSRFNAHQETDWVPVSPGLALVVDRALAVAELSDGAFDPTAAPLVQAWGFGPAGDVAEPPSPARIAAARAAVDYRQLQTRREPPALRKLRPDITVDLSAIAKGFGVDRLAAVLTRAGMRDFLVEIGGELRTRGRRPDGRAWRVGIERPDSAGRRVQHIVAMRANGAIATSGDYRNFFAVDGQRYSHIIDPRSGAPVDHELASVTVITDNCTDADALATALLVLGPEAGFQLASANGLAVLLITRSADGFSEQSTPAFDRWLGSD